METFAKGFSLLEIISTLAISSILIGLAVPFIGNLISENRVSGQINTLRGTIALTRSEAITRQQDVVLCKSADQQMCTRQGSWDQGYIVFVDTNHDRRRNQQESLLHVQATLPSNITLNYRAFGSRHYLAYHATGFTQTNGTFTFCNRGMPDRAKALIVTKTGRVRLSEKRADGSALVCPTSG